MLYKTVIFIFIFIQNFSLILSSEGDRSPFYQNCVKSCTTANCTTDGSFTSTALDQQDRWSRLLQWGCRDECRYHCMWRTTNAMTERGFPIPKFHGKWPFIRMLGVQEPASALCSVLNLLSHIYMFSKIHWDKSLSLKTTPLLWFWYIVFAEPASALCSVLNLLSHVYMFSKIHRDKSLSLKTTPLLWFWYIVFAVCVHAWTWSTIFHTRDNDFTEFMDYASALSMVMVLSVAAFVRSFYKRRKLTGIILLLSLAYFLEHARYLYSGRIDYEYNMTVNICCGVLGSTVWLVWSVFTLCGTGRRYMWRVVAFTKLSGAALLLELVDFPPLLHSWDAHALWHLSTAPLPLLFYRFVIDDLGCLQTEKLREKSDFKLA